MRRTPPRRSISRQIIGRRQPPTRCSAPTHPALRPDSQGEACVESFLDAAIRTAEFATKTAKAAALPLFVGGQSLGTFCAMHVVAKGFGSRLLLAAPPTTMLALAEASYPLVPIRWILAHRFDNLASAAKIEVPCLIVHGDRDGVVPWQMGRRLANAIRDARFIKATGIGHGVFGRFAPDRFARDISTLFDG